jgi:hypothetical protein
VEAKKVSTVRKVERGGVERGGLERGGVERGEMESGREGTSSEVRLCLEYSPRLGQGSLWTGVRLECLSLRLRPVPGVDISVYPPVREGPHLIIGLAGGGYKSKYSEQG